MRKIAIDSIYFASHFIHLAMFNKLGEVGAELKVSISSLLTLAYDLLEFTCFDFLEREE